MRSLLIACVLIVGCGSRPRPEGAEEEVEAASTTIEIVGGRLTVGSMPNLVGRDPLLEADRVPVEIEEFSIDRGLSGGTGAPTTSVSRAEASRACEARDMRLCGELEWERACAGDAGNTYATGATLDVARCRNASCASSLGVLDLGTRLGEWTGATVESNGHAYAVVRGSNADEPIGHRCAARRLVDPNARDASIGYRCCEGDGSQVAYPVERQRPVFETLDVDDERLALALASVPELAGVSSGFRAFTDVERNAVIARAASREPPFVVGADRVVRDVLVWTPSRNQTVWLVSGHSGSTAVIAVLYPRGDGGFSHAASLTMPSEPNAVVVTLRDPASKTLGFSTCFGCGGEDGEIRLRDDGRFVVVTR